MLCVGLICCAACGPDDVAPSTARTSAVPAPPPAPAETEWSAPAPVLDLLHREGAILRVLDAPPFDPPAAILDGDPATTWRSDLDRPGGLGTTVTLEVPDDARVVAIEIAVARSPGGPERERIELVRGATSLGVLEAATAPASPPARFEVGADGGRYALRLLERTARLHVREIRVLGRAPGAVEAHASVELLERGAHRGDAELIQLARRELRASVRALTRALARVRAPSDTELLALVHDVGWRALALIELQLGHACTRCEISGSAGLSQPFMADSLARACTDALERGRERRDAVRRFLALREVTAAAELLDTLVDPLEPVAVLDGLETRCASSPALVGEELLLSDAILDALERWHGAAASAPTTTTTPEAPAAE